MAALLVNQTGNQECVNTTNAHASRFFFSWWPCCCCTLHSFFSREDAFFCASKTRILSHLSFFFIHHLRNWTQSMCNIWHDQQNGKEKKKNVYTWKKHTHFRRMQHLRSKNVGNKMLNIQFYDNVHRLTDTNPGEWNQSYYD